MRIIPTRTGALAFFFLTCLGSQALAGAISVNVQAGFTYDSWSGSTPTSLSVTGVGVAGIGIASAFASADFGTLGASTSGSATPGPQTGGPTIASRAEATFSDLLFIGGPIGAPVDLIFTLDLAGTCSATPGATAGLVNASCLAQGSFAVANTGLSVTSGGPHSNSLSFTWVGGSPLPIAGVLLALGSAYDGSYSADFAHTLHFYASSSTPGVVITSESGHDYSPPAISSVPEPSTLVLLGTAMLAAVRRRARSSDAAHR